MSTAGDDAVAATGLDTLNINDKMSIAEPEKTAAQAGWSEPVPINYEAAASGYPVKPNFHTVARYQYNGDLGDIGPEDEEVEQMLFCDQFHVTAGRQFAKIMAYNVLVESKNKIDKVDRFENAGLHPILLDVVKNKIGYDFPTPIQQYTIPAVTHGADLVAIAQTGSGKTAAYLLPVISRLCGRAKTWGAPRPSFDGEPGSTDAKRAEPLVLIMAPTRELTLQIYEEALRFCYRTMLRPCVAYGGMNTDNNLSDLGKGCDILVATPGRLKHILQRFPDKLSLIRLNVLSGAGSNVNEDHHFMMFSATFNEKARELAENYLEKDYIRIRVGRSGSVHGNIVQSMVWVPQERKLQALFDLLTSMPPCRTLVFCNTLQTVEAVDDQLYNNGFPVTSLHSKRTQYEREDALRAFRTATCPILICTDVAGRGLDVKNIMHVINFDLPKDIRDYTHRIGRTARAGNMGQATSFYNDGDGERIGIELVNLLLETQQEIPNYLRKYVHPSGRAMFRESAEDEAFEDEGLVPTSDVPSGKAAIPQKATTSDDAWASTGNTWGTGPETSGANSSDLVW